MNNLKKDIKTFSDRWKITWNFFLDMEKELKEKLDKMYDDIRPIVQDLDNNILQQFRDVHRIYTSLFRGGMLIQFCSLVEYTMGQVCVLLIPQYENEYKKKRGNWLKKNLKLLKNNGITDINSEDILFFCDFITIRNCLVHCGGKIEEYKYPAKVKNSIKRLQDYGKERNEDISMEKDGYALLGVDAIPEVVFRGDEIIRKIFEYGLNNQHNLFDRRI